MHFPVADWQFYVVTVVGLVGLWLLMRTFFPATRGASGCRGCPVSGDAPPRKRRVSLTVRGGRSNGVGS